MKRNHVTQAYQNAEMQALQETDDPHKVILTMLEALVKSMTVFELNVDLRNGGDNELKSKHFARALIIIYALQSALDFEKGGEISNNLFQLYEFARQQLMADLNKGFANGTPDATRALKEILEAWQSLKIDG
ncbi:flagellar protein FliS [Alphaproteobacteria bacterium]|jgi:flagellar protein FliS|nr:flagellar protein FliS [Alphaproteobacteria bacterium]